MSSSEITGKEGLGRYLDRGASGPYEAVTTTATKREAAPWQEASQARRYDGENGFSIDTLSEYSWMPPSHPLSFPRHGKFRMWLHFFTSPQSRPSSGCTL